MDNIAEFILQTAEEAKRRGLEICIASVQVAPRQPENKPVVKPTVELAKTPSVNKAAVREQHSRLRIAEAARMLNVSLTCLYRRIKNGEIPTEVDRAVIVGMNRLGAIFTDIYTADLFIAVAFDSHVFSLDNRLRDSGIQYFQFGQGLMHGHAFMCHLLFSFEF